jgi:heterodisulfide reductase subunit C
MVSIIAAQRGRDEILERLKKELYVCFECGKCSGSCVVFRVKDDMNPRLFVSSILEASSIEEILEDENVWCCAICYDCSERCDQGIDFAHTLFELKNLSAENGNLPQAIKEELETLQATGRTSPFNARALKKRAALDLPEIQEPDLEAIQGLIDRATSFGKSKKSKVKED